MLSGWEGKSKSGVALAMCHGLQWFVRRKEDEPALLVGDTLYLYVWVLRPEFLGEEMYGA